MYIDNNNDTICAPATIPGTGAITVIRLSGNEAIGIADKLVHCHKENAIAQAQGYTMKFGKIYLENGALLDEVVVSIFRAPRSYTGEDSVEISCHASKYIVENLMYLLTSNGARTAMPGEFTQRAFLNGKMDLAQAEAVADLISAQNASAHRVALNQLKGGFSSELKTMRGSLLEIVSLMELELDFSEEEVEFADRSQLDSLVGNVISHISRLVESFRLGNAIKNGIPVAIAGATNTGKSTLLNALIGEERAIVSDIHGTTRDTIEETMNVGGLLFRFIDTAGIRETSEVVERIGIERTFRKIHEAEVILAMIDITREQADLAEVIEEILSKADASKQKILFILNKVDIVNTSIESSCSDSMKTKISSIESIIKEKTGGHSPIVRISAKKGTGIDELKTLLSNTCKDYAADSDTTLVTNMRHLEALSSAKACLERVKEGLSANIPTDLVSQDIREAIYHLGSIVGEISTDEVLGNIFRNFCIGK